MYHVGVQSVRFLHCLQLHRLDALNYLNMVMKLQAIRVDSLDKNTAGAVHTTPTSIMAMVSFTYSAYIRVQFKTHSNSLGRSSLSVVWGAIISGGCDGSLRVWDINSKYEILASYLTLTAILLSSSIRMLGRPPGVHPCFHNVIECRSLIRSA